MEYILFKRIIVADELSQLPNNNNQNTIPSTYQQFVIFLTSMN